MQKVSNVRKLTGTAMLSAVAFVLMFIDFSVPFMPSFVKMDVSELPALLAGFAYGPAYAVLVCLVKNLIHLTITTTGGVGELCNFMLGAFFTAPAAFIYMKKKSRNSAVIGAVAGAVIMAVVSVPANYFITYPFYTNFMPMEVIISMYQAIYSGVNNLLECLIVFNMPFNLLKGALTTLFCFLVYKPLSPILHGRK